jgi:hypothetical protein
MTNPKHPGAPMKTEKQLPPAKQIEQERQRLAKTVLLLIADDGKIRLGDLQHLIATARDLATLVSRPS